MAKRQLKLGAFMRPVSIHTGAWRYPGAWPDANFNFPHIKKLIQKLGVDLPTAMMISGHRTDSVARRYDIVDRTTLEMIRPKLHGTV